MSLMLEKKVLTVPVVFSKPFCVKRLFHHASGAVVAEPVVFTVALAVVPVAAVFLRRKKYQIAASAAAVAANIHRFFFIK